MNSFDLSEKLIPNLGRFDLVIANQVPEFRGLIKEGSIVKVLIEGEITQDIIDSIEAIIPPSNPLKDVTPRQIRQALILSGVSISSIDSAIDSMEEPIKSLARAEWEYSNAFERNRPLVAQIGQMLGWTSTQLDDLWILAATL